MMKHNNKLYPTLYSNLSSRAWQIVETSTISCLVRFPLQYLKMQLECLIFHRTIVNGNSIRFFHIHALVHFYCISNSVLSVSEMETLIVMLKFNVQFFSWYVTLDIREKLVHLNPRVLQH